VKSQGWQGLPPAAGHQISSAISWSKGFVCEAGLWAVRRRAQAPGWWNWQELAARWFAVDLAGADRIAALTSDIDGNVLRRGERRIGSVRGVLVSDVVDAINEILDTAGGTFRAGRRIGVTTPGLVRHDHRHRYSSQSLWTGSMFRLGSSTPETFRLSVFIGKDTHC